MKAKILDINGKEIKEIKLPTQFDEPYRPDLIKKAVLAIQANNRQPYGTKKGAGMRQRGKLSRRRRKYKGAYGRGISRVPRKTMTKRGTQFYWVGAEAPSTVGGRRAHPPKAEKDWHQKLNLNEKRKAIRSALNATTIKEIVQARGHRTDIAPFVIDGKIEEISKTKELHKILNKIGLGSELDRIMKKKVRAGKGKMRGRKYKTKTGPLFIVSEKCKLIDATTNLLGIDTTLVNNLNAALLAPGCTPGRLCIWSDKAMDKLGKEKLFMKKVRK
ncbi:MAG: 50S ribosomal protein L4 [Nanoarchaeota archaeon]